MILGKLNRCMFMAILNFMYIYMYVLRKGDVASYF